MNTVAWAISGRNESRDVYALFGATALWVSKGLDDGNSVWQYAPDEGRDEAVRYLTQITEYLEGSGWILQGDPLEFDLSDEALAQIMPRDEGEWIYAPTLREELLAAVKVAAWLPPKPEVYVSSTLPAGSKSYGSWSVRTDPLKPGDFWIDTSGGSAPTLKFWTGTDWSKVALHTDGEVIG